MYRLWHGNVLLSDDVKLLGPFFPTTSPLLLPKRTTNQRNLSPVPFKKMASNPTSNTPSSPADEQARLVHSQEQPTVFATTDASGYPDRMDGLSAHTNQIVLQDPHEHHKHTQVLESDLPTDQQHHPHPPAPQNGHSHSEHHHHSHAHGHTYGHTHQGAGGQDDEIGKAAVELAGRLHDSELPPGTAVPNFLR
ncbi:hypothetical protein B0O80DRAFT_487095 [Mortierella sp. GBAus27b]|nr:hypothetical protein B0O80DRAFT_487095 [Mortierella sp. GBAus27b]